MIGGRDIGKDNDVAQRVRRKWKLGFGYRLAVFILWPFMKTFTRKDWRNTEVLNAHDGGIIVAANHMSWIDPIAISYVLWENDRPPRFLAKEPIFRIKVIGPIVKSAGQIPVFRESRDAIAAVRSAVDAVNNGECVVVYPEGTITRDPNLWPMDAKTGAARIALATGRPLIPMAHWGCQNIMAPYKKEFKILPPKRIHVIFGEPIDLSDLAGRPMDTETLNIATNRLMDAITELQAELRGEQPPAQRYVHSRKKKDDAQ